MTNPLILASSSPYRRELLQRLKLEFSCISPNIDESRQENEPADKLALRLAQEKALVIAQNHPDSIVIGSDQVAEVDGTILGKPGSVAKAIEQLMLSSGKTTTFHTGVCIIGQGKTLATSIPYHVDFRAFDQEAATRYIELEQPLDCSGSFKCEGLGISLFKRQYGDDPTSLIGLPLIKTCEYLRELGLQLP